MPSDGVEDVEGVANGADVDTGQGRLLVHWRRGGQGRRGDGGIPDRRCF